MLAAVTTRSLGDIECLAGRVLRTVKYFKGTPAQPPSAAPATTTTTINRWISSKSSKQTNNDQASVISAQQATGTSQPSIKPAGESKELQELRTDRALLYPEQMDWLDDRLVRISKPTKNVMQSGTIYTNCWKIEFNSEPRYEYWLMGWTSTNDPVSNTSLTFPTRESAVAFCDKNKLQWFVEEQPERKLRKKSYADNFSWNKRTRLSNK